MGKSMSAPSAEFVPLQLETTDISPGSQEIQIEVRRKRRGNPP
jgi:hypothetical protein